MKKQLFYIIGLTIILSGCGQNTEDKSEASETLVSTSEQIIETEEDAVQEEDLGTDNFAVEEEKVEAFALQIKNAVAEQDLEALADLTIFPVYIGFDEADKTIESKEEMLALEEEKVFTEALMNSVAQTDETKLSPSKAGFVLSGEDSTANIIFGLRDGKLAILEINY